MGIHEPLPCCPAGHSGQHGDYHSIIEHWLLRLLIRLDLHHYFNHESGFRNDEIAVHLGLSSGVGENKHDRAEVLAGLMQRLERFDADPPALPADSLIARQLRWFGQRVGLDALAGELLHFTVLAYTTPALEAALDALGGLRLRDVIRIYAMCLNRSRQEIATALREDTPLMKSGILWIDPDGQFNFLGKVELPQDIVSRLGMPLDDPIDLFRDVVAPPRKPRLALAHYPHLAGELAVLRPYLSTALETRQAGVNVLVYGPPGTGKSELVRALAKSLGKTLHEVSIRRSSGAPLFGVERLRSCRLAQTLLGGAGDALLMFDEMEDIFAVEPEALRRGGRPFTKSWLNQFLENNAMPTFWISNSIREMDPAFLRRFDYVLKLDVPPRNVRNRILGDNLAGLPVSASWVRHMAGHDRLAPAIVERAVKVLAAVKDVLPVDRYETALERVLGNTLEAMGHDRKPRHDAHANTRYRLDCLNADCDLERLRDGLMSRHAGRICLYGPPGTGKTAFGRHIAEVLDAPLLVKRASDILSPWVGETEQNLARMFEETARENAVLLLDEADSFLHDRQGATRSWEISQVNEMLTQMENFEGIFIASTNLMDSLDAASLRRFDLKVKFGYLRREQVLTMFVDTLRQLDIHGAPDASSMKQLGALAFLTPGDFAAVMRQSRLTPIDTHAMLCEALLKEQAVKTGLGKQVMGFLA